MACKYKSRVWDNGWCNIACSYCTLTQECTCEHNRQTNADRIRAASDMEIAKLFTQAVANGCPPDMDWDCKKDDCGWEACDKCWCKWLQQHSEEMQKVSDQIDRLLGIGGAARG